MLRNFLADRAGNFAMWLVIGAIPLLAVTAGALDYTTISSKRSHIQAALDAAALATAREFRSGKSEAELRQLAKDVFRGNYPPADETNFYYQGDIDRWGFVRVEVSASVPHSGLIGWDFWQADAQTVVTLSPQEPGCLLALHETASAAIHIGGSARSI